MDTEDVGQSSKEYNVVIVEHPEEAEISQCVSQSVAAHKKKDAAKKVKKKDPAKKVEKKDGAKKAKTKDKGRKRQRSRGKKSRSPSPVRKEVFPLKSAPVEVLGFASIIKDGIISQNLVLQVLRHCPTFHKLLCSTFQHVNCDWNCNKFICIVRDFITARHDGELAVTAAQKLYDRYFSLMMASIDVGPKGVNSHIYWIGMVQYLSQIYDHRTMEDLCIMKTDLKDTCKACGYVKKYSLRLASLIVPAEKLAKDTFTFDLKCLDWGQMLKKVHSCTRCRKRTHHRKLTILNAPHTLAIKVVEHKGFYYHSDKVVVPTAEGTIVYRAFAIVSVQSFSDFEYEVLYLWHKGEWYLYDGKFTTPFDRQVVFTQKYDLLFCQKVGALKHTMERNGRKRSVNLSIEDRVAEEENPVGRRKRKVGDVPFVIGGKVVKSSELVACDNAEMVPSDADDGRGGVTDDEEDVGNACYGADAASSLHGGGGCDDDETVTISDSDETLTGSEDSVNEDVTEGSRMIRVKLNDIRAVALLLPGQRTAEYVKLRDDWDHDDVNNPFTDGYQIKVPEDFRIRGKNPPFWIKEALSSDKFSIFARGKCSFDLISFKLNGLCNASFMCVILQILRLSRPFRYTFLASKHHFCNSVEDELCLFCGMLKLVRGDDLTNTAYSIFTTLVALHPEKFPSALSYDCRVFYVHLIQHIKKYMLPYRYQDCFVASLVKSTECKSCKFTIASAVMVYYLILTVKKRQNNWCLETAVKEYFAGQTLESDCPQCAKATRSLSRCKLAGAPRNLVFCVSNVHDSKPDTVAFFSDITVPVGNAKVEYTPYAIVYSYKDSKTNGNTFSAYIRHRNRYLWCKVVGETIATCEWSDVIEDRRMPYMFFFERAPTDPNKAQHPNNQRASTKQVNKSTKQIGGRDNAVPGSGKHGPGSGKHTGGKSQKESKVVVPEKSSRDSSKANQSTLKYPVISNVVSLAPGAGQADSAEFTAVQQAQRNMQMMDVQAQLPSGNSQPIQVLCPSQGSAISNAGLCFVKMDNAIVPAKFTVDAKSVRSLCEQNSRVVTLSDNTVRDVRTYVIQTVRSADMQSVGVSPHLNIESEVVVAQDGNEVRDGRISTVTESPPSNIDNETSHSVGECWNIVNSSNNKVTEGAYTAHEPASDKILNIDNISSEVNAANNENVGTDNPAYSETVPSNDGMAVSCEEEPPMCSTSSAFVCDQTNGNYDQDVIQARPNMVLETEAGCSELSDEGALTKVTSMTVTGQQPVINQIYSVQQQKAHPGTETITLPVLHMECQPEGDVNQGTMDMSSQIMIKTEPDLVIDDVSMETVAMEREAVTEWVVVKSEEGCDEIGECVIKQDHQSSPRSVSMTTDAMVPDDVSEEILKEQNNQPVGIKTEPIDEDWLYYDDMQGQIKSENESEN